MTLMQLPLLFQLPCAQLLLLLQLQLLQLSGECGIGGDRKSCYC